MAKYILKRKTFGKYSAILNPFKQIGSAFSGKSIVKGKQLSGWGRFGRGAAGVGMLAVPTVPIAMGIGATRATGKALNGDIDKVNNFETGSMIAMGGGLSSGASHQNWIDKGQSLVGGGNAAPASGGIWNSISNGVGNAVDKTKAVATGLTTD